MRIQYDFRGQLTGVLDEAGNAVEKYEYDRAGNVLAKTVKGETTTYAYDAANQLVTATDSKGEVTKYAYDAAGRMVKEGDKTYKYGYLDKVLSVTDGSDKYTYDYHVDGQLATATYGNTMEDFLWDGLALVKRGKRGFVNEPHVGGGNPVMSSDGTTYFNDMLGTTLSSSVNGETTASSLTAFGAETHNSQLTTHNSASDSFFTGKPFVPGLGHAFLFRNYRSDLGKWQTADPLGYPDGWNQLAYCGNGVTSAVDLFGCEVFDYFDHAWEVIFGWWAWGDGSDKVIKNDSYFNYYMNQSVMLRSQIDDAVLPLVGRGKDPNISVTTVGEFEQNGYVTGYGLLHGTNADVGGLQISGHFCQSGSRTELGREIVRFHISLDCTWNDIIDPNPSYQLDTFLSFICNHSMVLDPHDYTIHIKWHLEFDYYVVYPREVRPTKLPE